MSGTNSGALFNATYYLQNNPDVVAAIAKGQFVSALDHFNKFGQYENRSPNIIFNGAQYLINNPDIAAAVGSKQLASAWAHFTSFGIAELRNSGVFTGSFNEAVYLAANPDVAAAVKAGSFVNGYQHFLLFGQNESRNGTPALTTGQTFTLTTGVDNFVGPATGNSTFSAFAATGGTFTTGDTLSVSDIVQGRGPSNVFNLVNTGATTDATSGAQISGIQTFNIRNTAATGTSTALDASKVAGLTAVNAALSTGDVTVTKLAAGASAGIVGNATLANGLFSASYLDAVTAAALNLSGGVSTAGLVTIFGAGITSTVVSSTGAANKLSGGLTLAATDTSLTINAATNLTVNAITAAALTGIVVTGAAANVNLGTAPATVKTIDASGLTTGGVTLTTGAALTAFTGGAGNNTLTINAAPTAAASVKFGAGNDKLLGTVALANTFSADGGTGNNTVSSGLLNAGNAAKFTNFQTLSLQSTANATATLSAFDVSLVAGITALSIDAVNVSTSVVYSNVTQALGLTDTLVGDNSASSNVLSFTGLTGTANAYTNTFAGAAQTAIAASANVKEGTVTLAGINNVNIVSGGGANTWNSLILGNDAAANTLTITGAQNLDVTFATITSSVGFGSLSNAVSGATGVTLINGTGATGKLSINETNIVGAASGLTVKGGTGNDTLTASSFASTMTGGGGADTFVIGAAQAVTNSSTSVFTTITDVIVGDKISFAAPTGQNTDGGFNNTVLNIGTAGTLALALDAAVAGLGATASASKEGYFNFNGNTYVVQHFGSGTTLTTGDVFAKLNTIGLTGAVYTTTNNTLTIA